MEVIYRKPILERIDYAVKVARDECRSIDTIYLNKHEFEELCLALRSKNKTYPRASNRAWYNGLCCVRKDRE